LIRSTMFTSCVVRNCFGSSNAEYPGPAQPNRI
jgi:hypothetical protein